MFESVVSVTQDLASRVQLQRLRLLIPSQEDKSDANFASNRFRVHGWRWHHLGIVRDLARLHKQGTSRKEQLCDVRNPAARASRKEFLEALRYIIHDNWALHNLVEEHIFLPWVDSRERNGATEQQRTIIANERERLAGECQNLTDRVDRWVTGTPRSCERDVDTILGSVQRLKHNAATLFEMSEAVLVPRVMRLFSEKEQLKFNSTVLKHITGRQARISLVIFTDAVDQSKPTIARKTDRDDYENSVPGPIRRLAVPYWRNKFVSERSRFITEGGSK